MCTGPGHSSELNPTYLQVLRVKGQGIKVTTVFMTVYLGKTRFFMFGKHRLLLFILNHTIRLHLCLWTEFRFGHTSKGFCSLKTRTTVWLILHPNNLSPWPWSIGPLVMVATLTTPPGVKWVQNELYEYSDYSTKHARQSWIDSLVPLTNPLIPVLSQGQHVALQIEGSRLAFWAIHNNGQWPRINGFSEAFGRNWVEVNWAGFWTAESWLKLGWTL